MADFTSIYGADYQNGVQHTQWYTPAAQVTLTGGILGENCVICIKFELPTDAKSITLSFCNAVGGATARANMRYKFTDQEDSSLTNATSNTPGDGTFSIEPGSSVRTTITIEKFLAAGTHYMYIWTDTNTTGNFMYIRWHTGEYGIQSSYEELNGCVYIDDGVSFEMYECYIDNGSSWEQHIPCIDNGTSWEMCG